MASRTRLSSRRRTSPWFDALEVRSLLSVLPTAAASHGVIPHEPVQVAPHARTTHHTAQPAHTLAHSQQPRAHTSITASDARWMAPFGANPLASSTPATPYTPTQVSHAYAFDTLPLINGSIPNDGTGVTIAIVDAYNDPNIKSDLHTFDHQFGLPDPPSFHKVDQNGGTNYPRTDSGWSLEISLDVEWAHAIAPGANILLVEAKTNSYANLMAAEDYAKAHAQVVSNSWGSSEFSGETSYDSHFTPNGHNVAFTVSSGDSGVQQYPAVSPDVLAVGGTYLPLDISGTPINPETGWAGSGGGVSSYEGKPGYQSGLMAQYSNNRLNPDIAYNADPNTGVYVYDSVLYQGHAGWWEVGGTSAGAPQWAALLALADQGRLTALSGVEPMNLIYGLAGNPQYFTDITTGNNGFNAGGGFDLVTGWGSPIANQLVPYLRTHTATTSP